MRLQIYTTDTPGYALGTAFVGIGVLALFLPEYTQRKFGVLLPPTEKYPATITEKPDEQNKSTIPGLPIGRLPQNAYYISKAGRDIVFGVLFAYLQWREDHVGVAALLGTLSIAGLTDGYAVWTCGPEATRKRDASLHWVGSGALLFTAWRLLTQQER